MLDAWNRCHECGQFISFQDIIDGEATHTMVEPSSHFGKEKWDTLCRKHKEREE